MVIMRANWVRAQVAAVVLQVLTAQQLQRALPDAPLLFASVLCLMQVCGCCTGWIRWATEFGIGAGDWRIDHHGLRILVGTLLVSKGRRAHSAPAAAIGVGALAWLPLQPWRQM